MKINEHYMLKEIAGEYMLVYQDETNVDFSKVISLNELGAFIFKGISKGLNEEEIVVAIIKEYEGAPIEVVKEDVATFVNRLKELEIVYA